MVFYSFFPNRTCLLHTSFWKTILIICMHKSINCQHTRLLTLSTPRIFNYHWWVHRESTHFICFINTDMGAYSNTIFNIGANDFIWVAIPTKFFHICNYKSLGIIKLFSSCISNDFEVWLGYTWLGCIICIFIFLPSIIAPTTWWWSKIYESISSRVVWCPTLTLYYIVTFLV